VGNVLMRLRQRSAAALIGLQLAAIAVVGGVTVARFHIFAGVDELAHISVVQQFAEHGSLPKEGSSYVSWQMEAIEQDTYPRRSSVNPRQIGLGGYSYEAWQPPLYYVLAAPAFLIPSNYRDKVFAVRAFDLLLLLAAVAILALLARAVAAEHWQTAYAAALSVVLWPGVIVRAITVSNAALELPLVLLYVLAVWHGTRRPQARLLLGAAGLLGLCLLTGLTLAFIAPLLAVPIVALCRERRGRARAAALRVAALAAVLPVALLSPWLIANEVRYGALTAGSAMRRISLSYVDPTGQRYGVDAALSSLWHLDHAMLPQEWWPQYGKAGLEVILLAVPALLLAGALAPALRRPALLRSSAAGLLLWPVLLGAFMLFVGEVLANWPVIFPRYITAALPLLALFATWAWQATGSRQATLLAATAAVSLLSVGVWVFMAGAYYFTNVGAALGIHAS
jgi:hypothetical protein